jgi:hypothetical protein
MRAAQATLIDLFELRSGTSYTVGPSAPVQAPRMSIDLEIDWDEVRATADKSGVRPIPTSDEDEWTSSSSDSAPGVSYESWRRARGWCAE